MRYLDNIRESLYSLMSLCVSENHTIGYSRLCTNFEEQAPEGVACGGRGTGEDAQGQVGESLVSYDACREVTFPEKSRPILRPLEGRSRAIRESEL